ncbi:MAG: hypothetical protein U1F25_12840 [Rubrivivax sp.]
MVVRAAGDDGARGDQVLRARLGSTQALPAADGLFGFYSPLTRAWEFAAGSTVALLVSRGAFATRAVHPLPIAMAALWDSSLRCC